MTTEVLVSLAEISVVAKGRKSAADLEAEARLYGLTVVENWRGEKCLSPQQAKDLATGVAESVYLHEAKWRKHLEADAEWQRRQHAAASAAAERKRAEHDASGRHVDAQAWGEQSAEAKAAFLQFEADTPRPEWSSA